VDDLLASPELPATVYRLRIWVEFDSVDVTMKDSGSVVTSDSLKLVYIKIISVADGKYQSVLLPPA
jgi:hypothetical protein